jgi:hypothetical protein
MKNKVKRFRLSSVILAFAVFGLYSTSSKATAQSSILSVNYRNLVSRADLTYDKPVARSEEGLPVGNGRMGSLVWTSPSALKFQINRVDVYANNSYTNSFNRRDWDYAYGCGYVDIDFVDFGQDVFPNERTLQHLSVYDALATVEGNGVKAEVLAWHEQDVMAIKVTDRRKRPTTIRTNLRMLRHIAKSFPGQSQEYRIRQSSVVKTKHHTSTSRLHIQNGRIVLTQEFEEGDYYCSSAVAIGIVGRKSKAKIANVTEARLAAKPGKGSFTILIAGAATFDRKEDVIASALNQLEAASAKGYDGLLEANKKWWHSFWARAFIHLQSNDGVADFVEANYTYFLYIMASSSRGKFPPRYGCMIWSTEGDLHHWGAQHWWNNVSFYYHGLLPANRLELMDPMFNMYSGMHDACALAARQQWGSKGIFIPETVFFDGLAKLPDDIAEEMRELYLLRKPWSQRSKRFREFAFAKHPHNGRWNWKNYGGWVDGRWVYTEKGQGPYGHCVHLFSATAKIAYLFWQRYEYTLDKQWLRDRTYPMVKGVAEFYRNYPNVKKGRDGKYHIYYVNNNESWRGYRRDTMDEIAAMRGILPVAVRASDILGVDAELRAAWRDLLDNLAPLPTTPGQEGGPPRYSSHRPFYTYDLVTLETKDPEVVRLAKATFFPNGIDSKRGIHILDRTPIAAAMLGQPDIIKAWLPNQIRCLTPETDFCYFVQTGRTGVLANRMTLREGVNAIGVQRLGIISDALHLALCQSVPPGPGQESVIRVFAAWPKDWDAEYTLLCRGGFLVTSSMQKGQIEFVEVNSQLVGECRLRNPWGVDEVTLYRDGKKWKNMDGPLLIFQTRKNQVFVVVPKGSSPAQFKRMVLEKNSSAAKIF